MKSTQALFEWNKPMKHIVWMKSTQALFEWNKPMKHIVWMKSTQAFCLNETQQTFHADETYPSILFQ